MAAALTQDAVLNFLLLGGGSVKNSDLLLHFKGFVRDHADRDRNRELFKRFVNLLATVKEEDGVKYVVLRKQFRGPQVPDVVPTGAPAPAGDAGGRTILPAAGIMVTNNNNNMDATVGLTQLRSSAQALGTITEWTRLKTPPLSEPPEGGQPGGGLGPAPGVRRDGEKSRQVPVSPAAPRALGAREVRLKPEGGLHRDPPLHNVGVGPQLAPRRIRYRPSYRSAMSCDDDEEEDEEHLPTRRSSGGAVWPVNGPLTGAASSPSIIDYPAPPSSSSSSSSSDRRAPEIFIQQEDVGEPLGCAGPAWSSEAGQESPSLPGGSASTGHSLAAEAGFYRAPPDPGARPDVHRDQQRSEPARVQPGPTQGLQPGHRAGLCSSCPASEPGSGPSGPSSHEDHRARTGASGHVPQVSDVLQRSQRPAVSRSPHDATAQVLHLSTGDLLGELEEVGSSDGSASTPKLRLLSRTLSRDVRLRMCRSLGADLDQIVQDEVRGSEAARLNRLHLISSSLSLRANLSSSSLSSCSTPPRCRSLVELEEGAGHKAGRRSLPADPQEAHVGHVKQCLVPLEPREHAWYVKAAVGAWPDIYSLFREDPSLLGKHDFISGFTVLHWIAKHGDHRVLNTLWYGVQKLGLTFDVNARSLCGHTPLHIAAIHGSKNVMRLLIKTFSADVKLRDVAGKRPWQYLSTAMTPDIFQLLAAPARAALEGVGMSDPRQQQQRRRRHHLSTASSGERPSIVAGMPKVKRSTSLAAFLKHKSLLPFHGQQPGAST